MAARQSFKYGVVAVVVAVAIILAAIATSPATPQTGTSPVGATTSASQQLTTQPGDFVVLLTDPPDVPPGTTQLNLTYSAISLLVSFPNGTSNWIPVQASGTVDLLSLVNVTQTLGSVSIPTNSTVSKIQFTISSVSAVVNGRAFSVTTLSNQLIVSIANAGKTKSLSGVLLDLRPSLVQIQATNSTGGAVAYYILVPSATAVVKTNVTGDQFKVGSRFKLGDDDWDELNHAQRTLSQNVTVTSATLSVNGNMTQFSITLRNGGNTNATLFGLTLNGQFNSTMSCPPLYNSTSTTTSSREHQHNSTTTFTNHHEGGREGCFSLAFDHPQAIPFRINGTSLVPFIGFGDVRSIGKASWATLEPGQSITLSFSGVIQLGFGHQGFMPMPSIIILPIRGDTYTVRLMGEGFQTFQVNAT